MTNKELHLIVLWHRAIEKQNEIIKDISDRLKIIDCINVEWSAEKTVENYARFYGFSNESAERKLQICGGGNFLIITVLDENPNYKLVESNRGYEYLNYNIFELKLKYRSWFDGLHVVHTTNNEKETQHDICMLLGISLKDYLKTNNQPWDGKIKYIKKDLMGCNGYKNFKEMFYVLNETTNYAVLRNYEMLPDEFNTELHKDIDIICESYKDICNILNAKAKNSSKARVYNRVDGREIPYDIRYVGDDYYCYNFEKDMLSTRKINGNGISVLSDEYYFYSLIYHALYQKKFVSVDYYEKIYNLFKILGLNSKYNIEEYVSPFDLYFILLKDFMKKHNYNFCNFRKNVQYNDVILYVEDTANYLQKHYKLNKVKSCKIDEKAPSDYKFFDGYYEDKHVFIKNGGLNKLCKNEFIMMQKVYERNNENFVKPYFYRSVNDEQNIVMEYIHGKSLQFLIDNNKMTDEIKKIILRDVEKIAKTLLETNIINRNIKLSNLILSDDKNLKLIDFRFAMIKDDTSTCNFGELENGQIEKKFIKWNDFVSLNKVLAELNLRSDFIENNISKMEVKARIKKHSKTGAFLQKIFSVTNDYRNQKKHKVINIFGIKIKF